MVAAASGKSYWNAPIGEDSEIVRVDFRLVDTFSGTIAPLLNPTAFPLCVPHEPATVVESILAANPPLPPAARIEAFRTLENLSPDTSEPPVLAANTAHHINLVPTLSTAARLAHSFPDLPAPPHDEQNPNELQRWA